METINSLQTRQIKTRTTETFPNSERLLHLLVKGATEYALILIDPDHRITYWNEGAHRIFGYDEEEILGKDIFTIFTPEDIKLGVAGKEIEKAALEGWAEDERWHQRKNGTHFWANGVLTCLRDPAGKVLGFSKVLRDQTQRKETEDQLKSVVSKLTQFTYGASHDLKEPLRSLSYFLEFIKRECYGKVSEEADQYLDLAAKQAERMNVLLENLLAYANSSDDTQIIEKTDSAAVFDMAVSNLKVLIEENGAMVTRGALPIINAVPGKLVQVFQNLIANSIKYRREECPQITTEAVMRGNEWVFSVTDNGEGIPPERTNDIFDPFKRLHGKDQVPGSGLGLSICKKIIERHKGRIWIESSSGKGTTVCFTLPNGIHVNRPCVR